MASGQMAVMELQEKVADNMVASVATKQAQFDYEGFGKALDALREEALADLGKKDVDYIRGIIRRKRYTELVGRGLLHVSLNPVTWAAGVFLLSVSKILENMEIGHNVMHGQYDWTRDPELNSQRYEWDTTCDSDSWRRTHNFEHHTFTNIIGKDRDYGYGLLRLSDDEEWTPRNLIQFIDFIALMVFFQWGVALHEFEFEKIRSGEKTLKDKAPLISPFLRKARKQVLKDYVVFPLLAGPLAPSVLLGNVLANLNRNLWASAVIFCGHFTEDAETFREEDCENESRGQWYYRQLLGSSNFTGGKWLHLMSGHLSYQIEHHLFPDIPSHRYPEMGKKVEQICQQFGLHYNTATFSKQFQTVLLRVAAYSFPKKRRPGFLKRRFA